MNNVNPVISARNLQKSYGHGTVKSEVLKGLEIDVRKGEFLAIMGPSGCGKSTLLYVLGLMTPQDGGTVDIEGTTVPSGEQVRTFIRRNTIGFVFQRFNLISSLSGEDNIKISLKVRGMAENGRTAAVMEQLGIMEAAKRKPSEMSIGEQQRFAIARAMAHDPAIIMADEPTGNLDRGNTEKLLVSFREIHESRNHTILMITHDPHVASCTDRILYMADGRLHKSETQPS